MEVLGKRADAYHEIRSVIQAISLCDILTLTENKDLEFRSTSSGWFADMSLVSKATELVRDSTNRHDGAIIEIEKHIPMMSGLGGDSSDAAAVLIGLDRLWELKLSDSELMAMAAKLGSDVPFFLHGGTALMEGRGESITPLPPLPRHYVVLVIPAIARTAGKTAAAYAALKSSHFTDGKITSRLVEDLKTGREIADSHLFNTFENVVFTPGAEITTYRSHIRKIGAPNVHLAGSGPALLTMLKDRLQAEDLATRLMNQGMEIYLAETCTCR
jgi:4-diphosphocytidyl-2-C-methyl-D-erythritol kinase